MTLPSRVVAQVINKSIKRGRMTRLIAGRNLYIEGQRHAAASIKINVSLNISSLTKLAEKIDENKNVKILCAFKGNI